MLPLLFLLTTTMAKRRSTSLKVRNIHFIKMLSVKKNFIKKHDSISKYISRSVIITPQCCSYSNLPPLGDRYYQYEFKHQPSHEECFQMSRIFPSALFRRYTDLYYDRWAEHFSQLFSGCKLLKLHVTADKTYNAKFYMLFFVFSVESQHGGNHFISKDWIGIKSPVDAVLAGRLYVSPRYVQRSSRRRQDQLGGQHRNQQWNQQLNQQWNQAWNQQTDKQWNQDWNQQWDQQQWGSRRRQNRSPFWDAMADKGLSFRQEFNQRFSHDNWRDPDRRINGYQQQYDNDYDYRYNPSDDSTFNRIRWSRPLQSVYFFKGGTEVKLSTLTSSICSAVDISSN